LRYVSQFHVEKRCLQVVEDAGEAVPMVFAGCPILAVITHASRKLCDVGVIRRDCPTVAVTAEKLERIKAPTAGQSPDACLPSTDAAAEALTRVLDHDEVMAFRDRDDARHICHPTA